MTIHANLTNVELKEARDLGVIERRVLPNGSHDLESIDPARLHKDLDRDNLVFRAVGDGGDFVVDSGDNVWDLSADPNGTDQWQHSFDDLSTAIEYAVARSEGTSWCLLTREGHVLEN